MFNNEKFKAVRYFKIKESASAKLLALLFLVLGVSSCTSEFEKYNTNSVGLTREQLNADNNYIGGLFPALQEVFSERVGVPLLFSVYYIGGTYSGYFMDNMDGARYPNYMMDMPSRDSHHLFNTGYNFAMTPIAEIKRRDAQTLAPDFWAIALILKVNIMHRVTNQYGPIPYSQFGQGGTSVGYDKQGDIYNAFFNELDEAVKLLKDYVAVYPNAKPFANFDRIFGGDYTKWLKFANTLRLRLAMQIVKRNPEKAKQEAEKAVLDGVMIENSDNAIVKQMGANMLPVVAKEWVDLLSNAALVTYMTGYDDPRISQYFAYSGIPGFTDTYVGIRNGASILTRQVNYSNIADRFNRSTPLQEMVAAEAYFLRAEGALRGWNMGDAAQPLYEKGVMLSLQQYNVPASSVTDYLSSTKTPADYIDPIYPVNNIKAQSDVTVKWDESLSKEQKLEKIITQKWIAIFPDGFEAWANFRRTGYPKLFPNKVNNSNGAISTDIQIRRQPYPLTESTNNPTGYTMGVSFLKSEKGASIAGETTNTGEDKGGTRLWWDVGGPNF